MGSNSKPNRMRKSNQQLATLQASIQANLQQLGTQAKQSTLPAPQETKKEQAKEEENAEITAEKQEQGPRQQSLYQASVENDTESVTKHGNGMPDSKITLSTFLRLCTTRSSRDPATCLSKVLLCAYQHALILMLNTLPGHIEHTEGMEATGQGCYQSSFDSSIPQTVAIRLIFMDSDPSVLFSADLHAEKEAPKALDFNHFLRLQARTGHYPSIIMLGAFDYHLATATSLSPHQCIAMRV
ncbi:hypothetical protein BDR22DRAFT_591499 [Usnea florida]